MRDKFYVRDFFVREFYVRDFVCEIFRYEHSLLCEKIKVYVGVALYFPAYNVLHSRRDVSHSTVGAVLFFLVFLRLDLKYEESPLHNLPALQKIQHLYRLGVVLLLSSRPDNAGFATTELAERIPGSWSRRWEWPCRVIDGHPGWRCRSM